MKIGVEVLSEEIVKPSSPTPQHLRHYQLSFLDQLAPPVYMPLVFFFQTNSGDVAGKSSHLKETLSEALSLFYPLAGRVVNNSYVDCTDEGALFVETKVDCELRQFLSDPEVGENNKFLAFELDDVDKPPLAVQVNFFQCGGIALGLTISHKIADALSFFTFLNAWSAIARDQVAVKPPQLGAADLFPPKDFSGFRSSFGITKENIIVKRFVFSAAAIASLRERYAGSTDGRRTTRVEALSAFVWNRFVASTRLAGSPESDRKIHSVLHAVNLRTRTDPPLSENSFGNISRIAVAFPNLKSEEEGLGIVNKMREEIGKIDAEYVKRLAQSDFHLNFIKERSAQAASGKLVSLSFTSLCRFPIYEADFGWGKPAWIGSACLTFKNLVTFFDTKTGDGIEAWIILEKEDMSKFEMDEQLLAHISATPNAYITENLN